MAVKNVSGQADGGTEDANATVPTSQYKNLQRELEKSRSRNRSLMAETLANRNLQASVERTESAVEAIAGVIASGDADEDTVSEITSKLKSRREVDQRASDAVGAVSKVLMEYDVDWDDERLAQARTVFDSGDTARAISLMETALEAEDGGSDRDGLMSDDAVEAEVQKRMKAAGVRVTTKDGQHAPGGKVRRDEITQTFSDEHASVQDLIKARDELRDRVFTSE